MRIVYALYYILVFPIWHLLFRINVTGRENIPDGPFLCCGNHTSMADIVFMAMAVTFKIHLYFMAKIEILKVPVIGFLFKKAGAFAVDRGKGDISAVKTTLTLLKKGEVVAIFPEGHRVRKDEESSVKNGVAMLAVRANVPMLPMYISPYKLFRRVDVYIGKPYYPEIDGKKAAAEDYSRISEELFKRIMSLPQRKSDGIN